MSKHILFRSALLLTWLAVPASDLAAQGTAARLGETSYDALAFRNIGPAINGGRIADIAIDPDDASVWYVAVGSGGVWKTENAGTTWQPIFDDQSSYSIGSLAIDPSSPATVWVGTGEDVGGRHVGFGDGVYKSTDGGKTWNNMGLTASEHISTMLVHPEKSDVVWVSAQGPLWTPGGEQIQKFESLHKNYVVDLAFTPGGERLISAVAASSIRLWIGTQPLPASHDPR